MANILQTPLLTDFLYPFLLMFFVIFAILEKSKVLGEDKSQINAFVSLVVGLIFVSAAGYVGVATDMILFMTVGVIVIFVGFILWGFISGTTPGFGMDSSLGRFFGVLVILGIVVAILISTGVAPTLWEGVNSVYSWIFHSSWSGGFWTNAIIVVLVLVAIGVVMGPVKKTVTGDTK